MFLRFVSALLACALIGSFLGAFHGVGDSLAVFRLGLAVALCCVALFSKWRWLIRLLFVVLAGLGAGSVGLYKLPGPDAGPIAVYQKNMFYRNSAHSDLIQDILSADVDIVLLQEVSKRNEPILSALQGRFPHQHLCRYTVNSGLAVLSRFPIAGEPACARGVGLASLPVRIEDQIVTLVSLHLTWPYPRPQLAQVDQLTGLLGQAGTPMIIGGDFNMVPWSDTLERITQASGTVQTGPSDDSFSLFGLPLPIDHVLAPGGGLKTMRPRLGSDHRGVVARVHLQPKSDSVENPN